jgi:magnesium-transporting ATPase (P-type)
MVIFSWLTTTINYVLLRRSYKQIKATAEKEFPVRVLRSGAFLETVNTELVPGDLYQLS